MSENKTSNVVIGTIIGSALLVIAFVVYVKFIEDKTREPTFIDFVQSGKITYAQIDNIEILKARRGVWEFAEGEYSKLERKIISSKGQIKEFVFLLKNNTICGRAQRNRRSTHCYKMYIKTNLKGGDFFYILFGIYMYEDYNYCSIDSMYRNVTNPNKGFHYENREFVSFLKKYDPWYPGCIELIK